MLWPSSFIEWRGRWNWATFPSKQAICKTVRERATPNSGLPCKAGWICSRPSPTSPPMTRQAAVKALRDQVRKATANFERERIESLEKFRKDFKDLLETYIYKRGCLVIFVDDLDRCLPEKAVEVLEAIKLFLDVPGCIFVLGIDHGVIERGIRLRYGEMGGARRTANDPAQCGSAIARHGRRRRALPRLFAGSGQKQPGE